MGQYAAFYISHRTESPFSLALCKKLAQKAVCILPAQISNSFCRFDISTHSCFFLSECDIRYFFPTYPKQSLKTIQSLMISLWRWKHRTPRSTQILQHIPCLPIPEITDKSLWLKLEPRTVSKKKKRKKPKHHNRTHFITCPAIPQVCLSQNWSKFKKYTVSWEQCLHIPAKFNCMCFHRKQKMR